MPIYATYNPLACEPYVPDFNISDMDFPKYILDNIDQDIL